MTASPLPETIEDQLAALRRGETTCAQQIGVFRSRGDFHGVMDLAAEALGQQYAMLALKQRTPLARLLLEERECWAAIDAAHEAGEWEAVMMAAERGQRVRIAQEVVKKMPPLRPWWRFW